MWILDERRKEQLERFAWRAARSEVARESQAGPPVLRVLVDEKPAQASETLRRSRSHRQRLQPIEGQVGSIRCDLNQLVPDRRGRSFIALQDTDVPEIEIGRHRSCVEVDSAFETADRLHVITPAHRLEADL